MILHFKKILFSLLFNSSLLLILFIGIQNSDKKTRVSFLINESVKLPISFIIGISFISGSIVGSVVGINEFFNSNNLEQD